MVAFHVVDEAVVAGTSQEVADARADESLGRSGWWMPVVQMKSRDGRRPDEMGAIVDYRVATMGGADRPGAVRFATRVTAAVPGRIESEYFEGAFRGRAVLTIEPVDETHTRIRYDWQTRTHGIVMGLLARAIDIEGGHSQAMRKGFLGMEAHIAAVRGSEQPRPRSD